jgi:hypothetical protein
MICLGIGKDLKKVIMKKWKIKEIILDQIKKIL